MVKRKKVSQRANKKVRSIFGNELKIRRKKKLLSQEKLGKISNLSGKFIGEVERGEKSISLDTLYRVAKALRTSIFKMVKRI